MQGAPVKGMLTVTKRPDSLLLPLPQGTGRHFPSLQVSGEEVSPEWEGRLPESRSRGLSQAFQPGLSVDLRS